MIRSVKNHIASTLHINTTLLIFGYLYQHVLRYCSEYVWIKRFKIWKLNSKTFWKKCDFCHVTGIFMTKFGLHFSIENQKRILSTMFDRVNPDYMDEVKPIFNWKLSYMLVCHYISVGLLIIIHIEFSLHFTTTYTQQLPLRFNAITHQLIYIIQPQASYNTRKPSPFANPRHLISLPSLHSPWPVVCKLL